MLAETFLLVHGWELPATDEQCDPAMLALAAGESSQKEFANWLRTYSGRA